MVIVIDFLSERSCAKNLKRNTGRAARYSTIRITAAVRGMPQRTPMMEKNLLPGYHIFMGGGEILITEALSSDFLAYKYIRKRAAVDQTATCTVANVVKKIYCFPHLFQFRPYGYDEKYFSPHFCNFFQ